MNDVKVQLSGLSVVSTLGKHTDYQDKILISKKIRKVTPWETDDKMLLVHGVFEGLDCVLMVKAEEYFKRFRNNMKNE